MQPSMPPEGQPARLPTGAAVTVRKLDSQGQVVFEYPARVEGNVPGGVRLLAEWGRPDLVLPYATFEHGACFREWFFADRWYNIFEIHDRDDVLHGWYCNVAAPATIRPGLIACRDLYLDLWVARDYHTLVLDEDEFVAAHDLDEHTRAQALGALVELRALVMRRDPPFGQ